jgi:sugar phosphate isomerase/epimerase
MSTISRRHFNALGAAALVPPLGRGLRGLAAMDTWFWASPEIPVPDQVDHLKRLGYAGLALSWGVQHKERLAACRAAGLAVPGIYTVVPIDDPAGPAWLPQVAAQLQGTNALVWLALTSKKHKRSDAAGDEAAAAVVAKLADLLKDAGLPGVAFYPHAGFWLERVGDGVRLAKRAGREDVGVQFNQYHWMAVEGGQDLAATLEAARPHLRGASINGSGLKPSILPLGEGAYDTFALLKALDAVGYKGPVASQGYSIKGDVPARLEASKKTWDAWMKRLEDAR